MLVNNDTMLTKRDDGGAFYTIDNCIDVLWGKVWKKAQVGDSAWHKPNIGIFVALNVIEHSGATSVDIAVAVKENLC